MKLREAEAAYRANRLDEARELLCQGDLPEYLPAKELMSKVADRLAERGQKQAELGQSMAGWKDLEAAADLGAGIETVGAARDALMHRAVAEAESYLAADNPAAALRRLETLQQRCRATAAVRQLIQVAGEMQVARRYAGQGNFAAADAALASAAELRPDLEFLGRRRDELRKKEITVRALRADLHDALANQHWSEVVNLAERLLELVPGDEVAADARQRAWAVAGMQLKPTPRESSGSPSPNGQRREKVAMQQNTPNPTAKTSRFLMWIDGVGGFLVCEGDEVVLGQPVPGSWVDVPILGDVSRDHAVIRRSGEGYLIVARRETKVDGRPVEAAATLVDGAEIELGEGVRLRFRQPHPLSRTARLEFLSRHRTDPPVDGVLLLAESCILGPGGNAHVLAHEWDHDVIVYRQNDELHCRLPGAFQIDGIGCQDQGLIHTNSRISSEEFSITLEEV